LDVVRSYLGEKSGTQFDPACVDSLLARWDDVETLYAKSGTARATDELRMAS
jgi:response regulator RpfG family c-di-GMP phosphodiesterase